MLSANYKERIILKLQNPLDILNKDNESKRQETFVLPLCFSE